MQLYQNQKTFSEFFSSFPKSTENSEYFEKKRWASKAISFWNYRLQKAELRKYPKSLLSEHLWTVNMLKGPTHFLNLHSSIFVIFLDHSEKKSAPRTLF